jgi:GT2 family glycosyltransferase
MSKWTVLHWELSDGVPTLPEVEEQGGIYLVFWANGVPLGHREIRAHELPLTPAQVEQMVLDYVTPAVGNHLFEHGFNVPLPDTPFHDEPCELQALIATERPLEALKQQQEAARRRDEAAPPTVSLVICTRDRPDDLQACLTSLRDLQRRPQQIIVVDNNPQTDATRQLVEAEEGIEYVLEPQPGLSRARNAGIAHSRGDIIVFTDDDVIVHPAWLDGVLQAFEQPDVMAVTGPVLPAELKTEAQVLFQQSQLNCGWGYRPQLFGANFFTHTQRNGAPVWRIGAGANMAFRRELFDKVGVFDERLGAGTSGCSEDSEMWYRVLAGGWTCRYHPAGAVFHVHRRDMDGLSHQMHQYMRGHVAALLVQWENHRHWGNVRRAYATLPLYYGQACLALGFTPTWCARKRP